MGYLLRDGEDLIKNIALCTSFLSRAGFIRRTTDSLLKIFFSKRTLSHYRDLIQMILGLISDVRAVEK